MLIPTQVATGILIMFVLFVLFWAFYIKVKYAELFAGAGGFTADVVREIIKKMQSEGCL